MRNQVASDLGALLERSNFPALAGVAEYTAARAAAAKNPRGWLQAAERIVANPSLRTGIRDFGSRQDAKATVWTKTLFRAASNRNSPFGSWWFDAELVERWERVFPAYLPRLARRQKIFEALRPMLVKMIERLGHEVLAEPDARTGLGQVRAQRPDLVVTDMVMPGGICIPLGICMPPGNCMPPGIPGITKGV